MCAYVRVRVCVFERVLSVCVLFSRFPLRFDVIEMLASALIDDFVQEPSDIVMDPMGNFFIASEFSNCIYMAYYNDTGDRCVERKGRERGERRQKKRKREERRRRRKGNEEDGREGKGKG
jgi:hypothetical protein